MRDYKWNDIAYSQTFTRMLRHDNSNGSDDDDDKNI